MTAVEVVKQALDEAAGFGTGTWADSSTPTSRRAAPTHLVDAAGDGSVSGDCTPTDCNAHRDGYWDECHWECCAHCSGAIGHDHTPWLMRLYWKTLGPLVSPLWFAGAARGWWN